MKKITVLLIYLAVLSCNNNTDNVYRNKLLNTCWAKTGKIISDSIKINPSDFPFHLHISKDGKATMSGMKLDFNFKKDGFKMYDVLYKIIDLSEKRMVIDKYEYGEAEHLNDYEYYYRIDCDSVNNTLDRISVPNFFERIILYFKLKNK